jgi:hypothetical protein
MQWFVAFKYLHIVSMFFAVALALSGELVVRRVASTLNASAIATTVERVKPLGNAATGLFLAGAVFGVIAALTGQINPFAPWLLLAYGFFVLAIVVGVTITDPWMARLGAAAATADGAGGTSDELRGIVAEPRARWGTILLMAIVATIVFLMVVKPLT